MKKIILIFCTLFIAVSLLSQSGVAMDTGSHRILASFSDKDSYSCKENVEPYPQLVFKRKTYGIDGQDILLFDKSEKRWKRFMTVDFPIRNISNYAGNILVSNRELTMLFILDTKKKELTPFVLPERIVGANISVKKFSIEIGSSGCFHYETSGRIYERKKDRFISNSKKDTTGDENEMPTQIDADDIEGLVRAIDSLKCHRLSLSDLEVIEKDIQNYQALVDEKALIGVDEDEAPEEQGHLELYLFEKNTDYTYYRDVVPLLGRVADDIMNIVFDPPLKQWDTTTNWRKIVFLLDDHSTLEIKNDDEIPNYFYSPWIVDYNGLKFKVNSFEIGKMINKLTNNCFLRRKFRDKNYPLFRIADFFYRKEVLRQSNFR